MAKEICISSTPHETRLAILEDDQLAEIYYERENEYTLAGSVYNGRVTRVLPGMQSAFVDIGLERDAFLYVTDFLELEDSEESEELEKAAASGGNQPPREVRHGNGHDRGQRGGREQRESRPVVEGEPSETEFTAPRDTAEQAPISSVEDPGAKRWRGRRRRRGGRGGSNMAAAPAETSEEFLETNVKETAAPAPQAAEIQASEAVPRGGRSERAPEPFVLPGESLSKYGGAPAETPQQALESAAPARPASTFKPANLIETPIVWDGSGLLPGESLSRHRVKPPEDTVPTHLSTGENAADEIEEPFFFEETASEVDAAPEHAVEPAVAQTLDDTASVPAEDEMVEESFEAGSAGYEPHEVAGEPVTEAGHREADEPESGSSSDTQVGFEGEAGENGADKEGTEFEGDRDASHKVDPLPPAEFRLFGLGGKKKKGDEAPPQPPIEEPRPASVPAVSKFSPGSGLVEEEVIEGEESDAPHHHQHKTEEHDLDEYEEEEKLHTQIRSGELGEMLQEAHLDHRIQLDFDDKNGEDGADETEEDEEEEASAAETQPSGDGHAPQRRDRTDRGGRGRRGRGDRAGHRPGDRRGQSRRSAQTSDLPIISDLLKPGQEILVQIAKEPIAKKGARITSHIALPGRFLVFMPTVSHVGVSRKISSDEERQRLKRILTHERGDASGGFIVRTAAEGASEEELRADLRFLIHLWNEIKQRSDSSKSPALIYHDLSLIERILRDQVSSNFSSIWVDSEADYERIVRFLNRFSP